MLVYNDAALASLGATIVNSPSTDGVLPAANILNADRKVMTRSASNPGGQVDYDIDLGASFDTTRTLGAFGVHYLQTAAPSGSGPDVEIYASATDFTTLTLMASKSGATYWNTARDWVESCAVQLTGLRYWRVRVKSISYQFSLGKFLVGTMVDFGFYYSPLSGYQWMTPGTETRTKDQDPVDLTLGEARRLYRFRYDEITDVERPALDAIGAYTKPMALLDPWGRSNHVWRPRSSPLALEHVFGDPPAGLYNAPELVLEQLP